MIRKRSLQTWNYLINPILHEYENRDCPYGFRCTRVLCWQQCVVWLKALGMNKHFVHCISCVAALVTAGCTKLPHCAQQPGSGAHGSGHHLESAGPTQNRSAWLVFYASCSAVVLHFGHLLESCLLSIMIDSDSSICTYVSASGIHSVTTGRGSTSDDD
jgi:hypothetical protein